jgi:predicted TIM-barrel fold metal-dependent hydrolase
VIDDVFVFDNVIHVYDMSDDNLLTDEPTAAQARDYMRAINVPLRSPDNRHYDFMKKWTPEEIHMMTFSDGGVDLAMAQAVPIFEWYRDWFAPVRAQYEMAQKYPDQVIFCGAVDPLFHGVQGAVREVHRQVGDLGARSFKFYNGHVNGGWRCDDPDVAYPIYEAIGEAGVDVVQFHKGVPFGQQDMRELHPGDVQCAARDFPDLKFLIHHLATPYVEEAFNIAARFPNVYLVASGVFNMSLIAPLRVQTWVGRLLGEVGVEKVIWGSETPFHGNPRVYIEDFLRLQVPEALQDGYGLPEITLDDKRLILGGNFARLMGVGVPNPGTEPVR